MMAPSAPPRAPLIAAVGAGRMGRGIAVAFAYAGHRVALVDLKPRPAQDAARLRDEAFGEIRGSLAALARLGALAAAELVLEGVPETLQAKRAAFEQLNRHCREDAILASTTSSILVTQIAQLVQRPERFLNMHWLNPAYLIPVVELSAHAGTDAGVLRRAAVLLESIGKVPVRCAAAPGYIVPRLQALVMNEAARMIEEGVASAEEIDKATRHGLGLRFAALGVVEFIDYGGCDILHHASREMSASVDAQRYAAPAIIGRMVDEGRVGLKSGSGFYDYAGRDIAAYREDVLARTFSLLRNAGLWRPAASALVAAGEAEA